jgi:hypothetical protein
VTVKEKHQWKQRLAMPRIRPVFLLRCCYLGELTGVNCFPAWYALPGWWLPSRRSQTINGGLVELLHCAAAIALRSITFHRACLRPSTAPVDSIYGVSFFFLFQCSSRGVSGGKLSSSSLPFGAEQRRLRVTRAMTFDRASLT